MKKRIIIYMLMMFLTSNFIEQIELIANAAIVSGSCGETLKWSLDDSTLIISGVGEMKDWSFASSVPWSSKRGSIKSIVIEEGVTSIGQNAFYNCTKIKNVTIPSTLERIGLSAFKGSSLAKNVYISDLVKWCSIDFLSSTSNPLNNSNSNGGGSLYIDGKIAENIIIPDEVKIIKKYAFYSCNSLKNIFICGNVENIEGYAFYNCFNLKSINLSTTVTFIGSYAFEGYIYLDEVNYTGTESEWTEIIIETGNDRLKETQINYRILTHTLQDDLYFNVFPLEVEHDACILIGYYKNNRMVYIDSYKYKDEEFVTFIINTVKYDSVKVYVWDNLNSVIPLGIYEDVV